MANRTNKYLDGAGLTYLIQKIKTVLNSKQDALTFDSTPTANSTNPVTSQGIKTELDKKENKFCELLQYDAVVKLWVGEYSSATEENPATLTADEVAQLDEIASRYMRGDKFTAWGVLINTGDGTWDESNGTLYFDTNLIGAGSSSNSLELCKSSNGYWISVKEYKWQKELTFDDTPTSGSSNPVESGGVYTALSNKQDTLVSGISIKTINNVSILGSGNIDADDVVHGALRGSDFVKGDWTNEGGTWTYSIPLSGGVITPDENKIYVDVSTNKIYRWKGSYVQIGGGDVTEMTNAEVDTMMTN